LEQKECPLGAFEVVGLKGYIGVGWEFPWEVFVG